MENPDDLCPRTPRLPKQATAPHSPPIYLSSVYECRDPDQADALLAGREAGYVYARDGHPNADMLAEQCRRLHGAEQAVIAGSGMGALALVVLSQLERGDHVVLSNQLYGRTSTLLTREAARLGIASTVVETCDLNAVENAFNSSTRLLVVETISNPLLRVANLGALADIARERGAALVADNTLAGPAICRPHEFGADWVMESITKTMNGHSDVVLGLLCGRTDRWDRVRETLSVWGLASAPFDCWLALRGLGTLGLRIERACANALAVAQFVSKSKSVGAVYYPGLPEHPDHELARRQFGDRYGTIVTFTLKGGLDAARSFMTASNRIPFCPSLGELSTTLSHPESTSHRGLTTQARQLLGITGGTIRLSLGIESAATIIDAIDEGLDSVG